LPMGTEKLESNQHSGITRRDFMKKSIRAGAALPVITLAAPGTACRGGRLAGEKGLLTRDTMEKLLGIMLERGGDFAEIYTQNSLSTAISLSEDKIKSIRYNVSQGVGFRVISGEEVGYAYSDDLSFQQLKNAARTAAMVAKSGGGGTNLVNLTRREAPARIHVETPLETIEERRKAETVLQANAAARDYDSRITDVIVNYTESTKSYQVANSQGTFIEDTLPLFRISVSVTAAGNGERQSGFNSFSRRSGWESVAEINPGDIAREAARQAVSMLDAREAPAGELPVILPAGWGGVLFHEAIGHGFEGDFVRKKTSVYSDKLGKKIASPVVTVVDDGTLENMRGSANFDSEGTPTSRTVLINEGVCEGFLFDILNAKLTGNKPTGNGRRQSFRYPPLPRMTNTFLLPGKASVSDLTVGVKKGLLVRQLSGGSVDITTGNFVFNVTEAYLVENGSISYPVRGASLIGKGSDILQRVEMVADNLDFGYGTCGKDGQGVPVCVGQPALRISHITVGGTAI